MNFNAELQRYWTVPDKSKTILYMRKNGTADWKLTVSEAISDAVAEMADPTPMGLYIAEISMKWLISNAPKQYRTHLQFTLYDLKACTASNWIY